MSQGVNTRTEKLRAEPKQVQSFLDALSEMAGEQTREAAEFTVAGLGKLVKADAEIKIAAKPTVKFRIAKAATDAIAPSEA